MKNYFAFLLLKLISVLPLGFLRSLSSFAGYFHWILNTRAKRTTLTNLAICFPDMSKSDRHKLARQSLIETMKTLFEAAIVWRRDWDWLKSKIVSVSNENVLLEKYNKQKGLIVITLHIGNWEVAAAYLANTIPVTALYQSSKYARVDQLIETARKNKKMDLAPSNVQGVKKVLQALKQKRAVCILPDQVPDRNTGRILSTFFNKPAWTMSLVQNLICRTDCEVCFCYALRSESGFTLHIVESNPEIKNEDLAISAGAMNADIESIARSAPAQYQWEYKRFRQLPPEHWVQYT